LAEKPMTQQQLVVRSSMDKVTVSRAAHGLVTRHLVGRAAHEADGRSHILTLTEQGRELHAEIAPLALAYEAALLSGLTPAEVETLKRLLMRLESAAGKLAGEAR
jgi:DNA-binding MarR family transcriptional regulator